MKLYKPFSPESGNIRSLIKSFEKNKDYIMLLKFTNLLYLIQLTDECYKYMRTPRIGNELDLKTITIETIDSYIQNINFNPQTFQTMDSSEIKRIQELDKTLLFFGFLHQFEDFIINYDREFEIKIDEFIKNDFIDKMPDYFEFNFVSKDNIRFNNLSTGEQDSLKLIYSIKDIIRKRDYATNNYYILLDEIGNSLHPNWQKKLINDLNLLFNSYKDKTFHLIITTHSPFILSDIPKENIIFLKDGKQKKPFKKDEQTFGANIHTLLSHGFFMSDGLMGEFAKSKINEIKRFYEIVKFLEPKNKKYKRILKILYLFKIKKFKHIQSIIGEPFLQTIIKNYLDDLHIIFSDDKTLIDKELAELEKRKKHLESLKNAKN